MSGDVGIKMGAVVLAVGLVAWVLTRPRPDAGAEEEGGAVEPSIVAQRELFGADAQTPFPDAEGGETGTVEVRPAEHVLEERVTAESCDPKIASEATLNALLPEWMLEQADLFYDQREILGQQVSRSRGRYEWDNGSMMEVEITDAGAGANNAVMQALGFNLNQMNHADVAGYTLTGDVEGRLINQEYDFNDMAGSFQLILDDRYLVEVQLQNLPAESFQLILDHQLSLDELRQGIDE